MPVREGPAQPAPPPKTEDVNDPRVYSAEKARGGEIILRSRAQRVIFIAGLAGAVIVGLLLAIFA